MAGAFERHRFTADHPGTVCAFAKAQRPNAKWIAKSQHTMTCDQGDDRIRTLDPTMHATDGAEDFVNTQRIATGGAFKLMGQHIEQHL